MNNIKEFIKKNQKKILIIDGVLIILLFILLVGVVFMNHDSSNKRELEKKLEKLGRDFYENEYYNLLSDNEEERKAFLKDYATSGIKVDLEVLQFREDAYDNENFNFINSQTNQPCDPNSTRVIIYPQGNFGRKDYKIEVELSCGFEK